MSVCVYKYTCIQFDNVLTAAFWLQLQLCCYWPRFLFSFLRVFLFFRGVNAMFILENGPTPHRALASLLLLLLFASSSSSKLSWLRSFLGFIRSVVVVIRSVIYNFCQHCSIKRSVLIWWFKKPLLIPILISVEVLKFRIWVNFTRSRFIMALKEPDI